MKHALRLTRLEARMGNSNADLSRLTDVALSIERRLWRRDPTLGLQALIKKVGAAGHVSDG